MNYVKSCGVVAYKRIDNINYYLIIKQINNDIGFPKGRMNKDENEVETAIRELKEETNIEVKLNNEYRVQIEYKIPNALKTVVYFLGEVINEDIIIQEQEVKEAYFLPYNDALNVISYNDTKDVLIEMEKYLNKE